MKIEFLSTSISAAAPARSPLLDAALAAGARTALRDGWEVADSFGDASEEATACLEAVGFADISQLGKLELQHSGNGSFTPGKASRILGGWRCPVRPTLDLVLVEPSELAATRESLAGEGRVCDLSGSLAALAISGPLARETFARLCALDLREGSLPVHGFRPGSVARTPGYVLREAPDRFLMLFGAAYGQYVWEVVADAVERLGGRPVGADALPAIAEEGEVARA
jgi:glycine cleavage system aminomethyltransferase T